MIRITASIIRLYLNRMTGRIADVTWIYSLFVPASKLSQGSFRGVPHVAGAELEIFSDRSELSFTLSQM